MKRVPGSNYRLGLIFERTAAEEAGHRAALREAITEASARRRGYDDPWWAANMKALLDYVEACEAALGPVVPHEACTGVAAIWCPVHGSCTCADREDLNDYDCPLHGDRSSHAELVR